MGQTPGKQRRSGVLMQLDSNFAVRLTNHEVNQIRDWMNDN